MQRNVMTLVLIGVTWHVRYSGAHRAEIVDLFGTDTLPTPFTDARPGEDVLARLQALNPDILVVGWAVNS